VGEKTTLKCCWFGDLKGEYEEYPDELE